MTAGASLGEQLIANLGKYFPKLAKIAAKILKAADKLSFGKGKKKPDVDLPNGPHLPHVDGLDAEDMPDPKDSDSMDWALTFAKAKMITELNDEVDTPVDALVKVLNATLASKSEAVAGYRREALGEPGHYRIAQFQKHKPAAVGNYTDKKDVIPGLSENGRSKPVALTPDELKKVKAWAFRRENFLAKWKSLDISSLPMDSQKLLRSSADASIYKNMSPDDLAAVIKELRGVQIAKPSGGNFDHLKEFANAKRSIINNIGDGKSGLTARINQLTVEGKTASYEYRLLVERRRDLNGILEGYKQFQIQ